MVLRIVNTGKRAIRPDDFAAAIENREPANLRVSILNVLNLSGLTTVVIRVWSIPADTGSSRSCLIVAITWTSSFSLTAELRCGLNCHAGLSISHRAMRQLAPPGIRFLDSSGKVLFTITARFPFVSASHHVQAAHRSLAVVEGPAAGEHDDPATQCLRRA